jgi:hypothetical protein
MSATTDTAGKLVFDQLMVGNFTVTEESRADYYATTAVSQQGSLSPNGDLELFFGNRRYEMDYGDLPQAYGYTLFGDNGARHKPLSCDLENGQDGSSCDVILGETRDIETDGSEDPAALGDDPTNHDEDGVVRGASWGGGTGVISVTVSGDSCLMGWVDFAKVNDDNEWTDFGADFQFTKVISGTETYNEKVIDNRYLTSGTHEITFDLPPGFANAAVFARFRLSPLVSEVNEDGTCSQPPAGLTGLVAGGEVEDYYWQFGATAVELKKVSGTAQQSTLGFGLAAVGFAVSLTALIVGRRRRENG